MSSTQIERASDETRCHGNADGEFGSQRSDLRLIRLNYRSSDPRSFEGILTELIRQRGERLHDGLSDHGWRVAGDPG